MFVWYTVITVFRYGFVMCKSKITWWSNKRILVPRYSKQYRDTSHVFYVRYTGGIEVILNNWFEDISDFQSVLEAAII